MSSIVRITSICPLPKMLPDHALDPVLQWEESDRVRPDQEADAFASSLRAHPSHSVRLRGARLWGCYRNGNNQSQSIQGWIMRAKRLQPLNGKVVIFWVTWTESVLLVPP